MCGGEVGIVLVEWTGEKVRDGWCDGGALTSASQKAGLKTLRALQVSPDSRGATPKLHLLSPDTTTGKKNLFYVYKYMYS